MAHADFSEFPLGIRLLGSAKRGRLRWQALWADLRMTKTFQASVLVAGIFLILQLSFYFLLSLIGAVAASLCLLFVLQQFFGLKISPYVVG